MSMIPMLSMFILTGSSIAFSKLASGAAASSPSETKPVAPEVSNGPSLMMISPPQTMSAGSVNRYSDAPTETFSIGTTLSNLMSSSTNKMRQAQHQLAANRGAAQQAVFDSLTNINAGTNFSKQTGETSGEAVTGDKGTGTANTKQTRHNITDGTSNIAGTDLAVRTDLVQLGQAVVPAGKPANIAKTAKGVAKSADGKGTGDLPVQVVASAHAGQEIKSSQDDTLSRASQQDEKAAWAERSLAEWKTGNSVTRDRITAEAARYGIGGETVQNFAHSYNTMEAESRNFTNADTLQRSLGSGYSIDAAQVAMLLHQRDPEGKLSAGFKPESMSQQEWDRQVAAERNILFNNGFSNDSADAVAPFAAAWHSGDAESMRKALSAIGHGTNGTNGVSAAAATQNQSLLPENFTSGIHKEQQSIIGGTTAGVNEAEREAKALETRVKNETPDDKKLKENYEAHAAETERKAEGDNLQVQQNSMQRDQAWKAVSDLGAYKSPQNGMTPQATVDALGPKLDPETKAELGAFLDMTARIGDGGIGGLNPEKLGGENYESFAVRYSMIRQSLDTKYSERTGYNGHITDDLLKTQSRMSNNTQFPKVFNSMTEGLSQKPEK